MEEVPPTNPESLEDNSEAMQSMAEAQAQGDKNVLLMVIVAVFVLLVLVVLFKKFF